MKNYIFYLTVILVIISCSDQVDKPKENTSDESPSIESLKDTMDYILNNPDLINKFSENGRILTTKKYNWLQTASDLENLYSKLI